MSDEIQSPCISVCQMNEDNICVGCFRSLDEIREWFQADNSKKQQILADAEHRKQELLNLNFQ